MMIKIEAYVREEKFEEVKQALTDIEVCGMTVSQVMGCGIQRGYKEVVRGMEVDTQMQPKIKFEIVVSIPYRKLPIQEKWEMEKSSVMKSAPH